ncbi:MAG TPA: hypothetical protein VJ785_16365 [Anaerolineales bacterium]|nr:hypothetical protein [Anaerolineales bacterium]
MLLTFLEVCVTLTSLLASCQGNKPIKNTDIEALAVCRGGRFANNHPVKKGGNFEDIEELGKTQYDPSQSSSGHYWFWELLPSTG